MSDWNIMMVDDDREMRESLVDLIGAAGRRAQTLSRTSVIECAPFRPQIGGAAHHSPRGQGGAVDRAGDSAYTARTRACVALPAMPEFRT